MRPKHVARLGTFIAGTLVSLITILLVYSTSSGIREWITQGRAAIGRSKTLTAQNAAMEAEIKAKTAQIDQLDREAKLARASLSQATTKLAAIQSDLATANARLADSTKRVTAGQVALAHNQALLRQNHTLLVARQAKLARVSARLTDLAATYGRLQKSYSAVDKERTEANEEVVNLRNQATSLGKEISSLRTESADLTRKTERANADLAKARDDLHDSRLALASVKNDLETARTDLDRARKEGSMLFTVAEKARSEPMTYAIGQEVARHRVDAHPSVRQVHDALTMLINDASIAARSRGAVARSNNDECAFVLEQQRPDGVIEEPAEILEAIVNSLTTSDRGAVVLVAHAAENAFRGESVPLQIVGHLNPIVYHKGDILGVLPVPRRLSQWAVLTQFNDFMSQRVHDRAIRMG
jgi:chromosome segregation ATPase